MTAESKGLLLWICKACWFATQWWNTGHAEIGQVWLDTHQFPAQNIIGKTTETTITTRKDVKVRSDLLKEIKIALCTV